MTTKWMTLIFFLLLMAQISRAKSFNFCERLNSLKGDQLEISDPKADLPELPITSLLVRKDIRRLFLLNNQTILKSYPVALGVNPSGHKRRQGDMKTPEGIYFISDKNPHSKYHKSLKISYPDTEDWLSAKKRGVDPGGDIFIHGLPNEAGLKRDLLDGIHPLIDWTLGCIALSDGEIEEIYSRVGIGTPIEICPLP